MGYTHYWKFKKSPMRMRTEGEVKFESAVESIKKCIAELPDKIGDEPLKLCGGDGTGEPIFSNTLVCFNGDGSCDNDHETCYISLESEGFDCCKTARKPYDVAVCITLICFSHWFGDNFEYGSDGDIENGEEGWALAKDITSKILQDV
jgi:hypothetical protein